MKTVYLSGPITGLTYDEGQDWRAYVETRLRLFPAVKGLSPLRGKEYLRAFGDLGSQYLNLHPLSTPHGIVHRDRNDSMKSDAILVNLLGAERVSIGTMIELGWADASRVPIVTVMEPEGNVHDHGMVTDVSGFIVPTLDEGINVVLTVLGYTVQL